MSIQTADKVLAVCAVCSQYQLLFKISLYYSAFDAVKQLDFGGGSYMLFKLLSFTQEHSTCMITSYIAKLQLLGFNIYIICRSDSFVKVKTFCKWEKAFFVQQ